MTRRDRILGEINAITPWSALVAEIEPFYPKGEGRGRPPIGLERMLRMYVAQQCFGLSDEGTADAIYDSQAIRSFVGIDLNREAAPDATTLLKFRRRLEERKLTERIFTAINAHLILKGLMLKEGTVVDATIIAASSSTKNQDGKRDPEMHQTKKGNQWHFGMKAHIGVDAESGITHTLVRPEMGETMKFTGKLDNCRPKTAAMQAFLARFSKNDEWLKPALLIFNQMLIYSALP
jgi:transposase, IS5 family